MMEDGGVGAGGGNFTFGGTTLSEFLSCVVKIHLDGACTFTYCFIE